MLIKSSNTAMMNLFQQEQDESLRSQESLRFQKSQDLKSKSSSFEMTLQQ